MRITPAGAKNSASTLFDGFQNHLVKRDLAPATIRVYLHDLTVFQHWLDEVYDASPPLILHTGTAELAAFRQYLLKEKSQRPATVNRRIQSLRLARRRSRRAHTLRHTFAANYLKTNPGKLVELADLMGHESLDTTAIYTWPSQADLSADLERSALNILAE